MLERMKKWLDSLITNSETNEQDINPINITNRPEQDIQTRMYYQYPKQGAFRFPVIPDEPNAGSQPKRRKPNKQSDNLTRKEKRKQHQKEKEQRPAFRSTEVPSPVYGFQTREEQTNKRIEEVPAFMRKKEDLAEEIEKYTDLQQLRHDKHQIEEEMNTNSNDDELFLNEDSQNSEEPNLVLFENTNMAEMEFEEQDELPQSVAIEDSKETQNTNVESEPFESRVERRRSRMPINVIMTASDRRNHFEKQKQPYTHQQETIKTEEEWIEKEADVSKQTKPPIHMLNDGPLRSDNDQEWVEEQKELLETTLKHFHVNAKVINAMRGPTVTRFEVQPAPGVKVNKITNLSDDIKLSLAAKDIRMEAPIPGKNAIGIEVPNQKAEAVGLQEILESNYFTESKSPLTVALGLDIAGTPMITDLKKMPHGLIAGATGSGKSVCINTILISLLYKAHYEDVKFLLIDPKMVELSPYNEIPHLVAPVITDVKAATLALKWAVKEMDERYEKFVNEGVRDIERYNHKMEAKSRSKEKMPYLVIVIDELADLMMVSPQDVEDAICRIAQKARACGIHLLLATQRPSVDVITGLIKANIPTRIAFSVSSQVDSRTIIDTSGAEKLLGRGDMLFLENGSGKTQRIQGAFVSDDEIERITNYMKKLATPTYAFEQEEIIQQMSFDEETDDLFEEAIDFVLDNGGASTSLLQRRYKIGYNRAARLIDSMEEMGIISEQRGSKPRDVLMSKEQISELFEQVTY